jgi:hypothetical protein
MPKLRKKGMLKGVGHAAAEEQPGRVSELIFEFLRNH